ncbi:hypothetical protein [Effusibacillus dendaii]|uniref:hypothetical protein n=1 Tax=Effusibacillus dendaii TaxID=2743772 RepID=UPI00190A89F7|nr:hypothetical protein [Effusibacillus dendaii]
MKELIFQAVVEGNELYSVYVELDGDGRIITLECDCPYDYGFVIWRNVDRAVEGTEIVAKRAHEAMEDEDGVLTVRMSLCIMEEMLNLLQSADDSGGIIGGIIEESFERIQEVTQSGDRFSRTEVEELFRLLLKESEHSLLEGWPDWQLALLESASRLAKTSDLLREWEEYVSRMISTQAEETWSGRYFAERIAVLRYRFIQENESRERAKEYLNQNLQFPEFRKFAIQQTLDNDRFEEAINLALEVEAVSI